MTTFLEFYLALLKFVNHKLFADLGLNLQTVLDQAYTDEQTLQI
jgi:hypothetical protein